MGFLRRGGWGVRQKGMGGRPARARFVHVLRERVGKAHGGGNAAERGLKIGHLQQSGAASNSTRRNVSMAFPPKFKSLLA